MFLNYIILNRFKANNIKRKMVKSQISICMKFSIKTYLPPPPRQGTNCDGLTSVFHIEIDACRRLWVLDQGKIGTSNTLLCQPQLLLYSLDTDALLSRYRLPIDQFKIGSSLWSSFTLDGADDCGAAATARAYLGDNRGHGLLVYDLAANASWRAQNKWTYPAPHAGTLRLAGESFDLMDGVFSVSLTPASAVVQLPAARRHGQQHANKPHRKPHRPAVGAGGGGQQTAPVTPPGLGHLGPGPVVIEPRQRSLYFHALASRFEVAVPLALLNNQSVWQASVEAQPQAFRPIGWRGVQAAAEVMDERRGNQFVGLIDPVAIACWNVHEAYTRRSLRVVAQNGETLQFASGLKVRRNVRLDRDELWVATNRQQKRANGSWRVGETNFRVQWVEMDRLVDVGGRCLGRALE